MNTVQTLAKELAVAAGEKDGTWRESGIQRDIDTSSETWQRWSSVAGWPFELAKRIDGFIVEQRKLKK